jgi:hypothetical protein
MNLLSFLLIFLSHSTLLAARRRHADYHEPQQDVFIFARGHSLS